MKHRQIGFAVALAAIAAGTAASAQTRRPPAHHLIAPELTWTALGPSPSGSTVFGVRYAFALPLLRYVGGTATEGGIVQEWDFTVGAGLRGTLPVSGVGGALGGAGRVGFRGVVGRTDWFLRVALQFDVGYVAMGHWATLGSTAGFLQGPETGLGIGPWMPLGPLALSILAQTRFALFFGGVSPQPELIAGLALQFEYTREP